jgi:N-acyl homoserine lactone hydrolase
MPAAAAGDELGLQREYGMDPAWIRPVMSLENRVDRQLRQLGLQPGDLDLVINTHLHFDHAGGNLFFPGVTIAVQREELDATSSDDYLPIWDAPDLEFRSVEGDWSPMPGVEMLFTPGHTPGHQSMLVRFTGREPWLFTWDAVYTQEHWLNQGLGAVVDVPLARRSVKRLRQVATDEKAKLIFGHDGVQWEALGMNDSSSPRLVASDETA